MRTEFTEKQHQTEVNNFKDYSDRCEKEFLKRHQSNQKQLPKNIKVKKIDQRNRRESYLNFFSDQTNGIETKI